MKKFFKRAEPQRKSAASWRIRSGEIALTANADGLLSGAPPSPGRSRSRMILILSAIAFTLFMPIGLHLPYFQGWLAARGFSESEIALALGFPTLLRVAALHWRAQSLTPGFIGAAWATGVASESGMFLLAARYFSAERNAGVFLITGALGAMVRWLAMSADPRPFFLIVLAAMHGLSFGATYFGSVLLLSGMAQESHRARMQGWLASASALSLALATFACGKLTSLLGEKAYLAMAAVAAAGLALALLAKAMKHKRA